jgi:hypothetical protein
MDYYVKYNKLTNYTPNFMEQGPFQKAANSSSSQETSYILRKQKIRHLMHNARHLCLSWHRWIQKEVAPKKLWELQDV